MREVFSSRNALVLVKSPSIRQQAVRRRALAAAGVLALAVVSGVVGVLSHQSSETLGKPQTGPFSYLSSE